jgi:hypothetical protein
MGGFKETEATNFDGIEVAKAIHGAFEVNASIMGLPKNTGSYVLGIPATIRVIVDSSCCTDGWAGCLKGGLNGLVVIECQKPRLHLLRKTTLSRVEII